MDTKIIDCLAFVKHGTSAENAVTEPSVQQGAAVTRDAASFGVGSVETGVNLPEVPQAIRESLETLKRRQEAYLSHQTAETVDGLYHFVRRTLSDQVGTSPVTVQLTP